MQYAIGAVILLLFLLCLAGAYYTGYRKGKSRGRPKLSPEEKRRLEQRKKEFSEMMGYNLDKAVKGGRL